MRVDGILHNIIEVPATLTATITSRLKVMADLDISEKRLPQDGRFTIKLYNGFKKDGRLSSCPTLFGEKLVLRILSSDKKLLNINELGLEKEQLLIFNTALQQPQGLILITGPTGSGKTISLYTALSILNNLENNIVTVEEPVEIKLLGINQVNVNHKAGLDFSTTLKAFLRQDPDIIMVGEIRDLETANTAIRAAQTGHLVLSTLHTNSAAATLTRLINMGIPAFNIASSVKLIIAQRLVRKLCNHCKKISSLSDQTLKKLGIPTSLLPLTHYQAHGCQYCNQGYKNRTGIYELMTITHNLSRYILSESSANILAEQAHQNGMQSLWESGLNKIASGITSLEEINRVVEKGTSQ